MLSKSCIKSEYEADSARRDFFVKKGINILSHSLRDLLSAPDCQIYNERPQRDRYSAWTP